jgi:hexosaminidase
VKPTLVALGAATLLVAACARPVPAPATTPTMTTAAHPIVPAPLSVTPGSGDPFTLSNTTRILVRGADARVVAVANHLARLVRVVEAPAPPAVDTGVDAPLDGGIHLSLGAAADRVGEEGYELTVTAKQVALGAATPAGLFHGVQTLRHLMPASVEYEAPRRRTLRIVPIHVLDKPRFAWRGSMLDVARHFFGVEEVKRYIDLLALLKINRLHLHLSDDQGWRIEIKSWPNLAKHGGSTEVGGGPGGFYTQDQFAAIVGYAAERFITIVPEIDMPSHINAAMASYPELNCDGVAPPLYTGIEVGFSAMCVDKEITYTFIDDVVREIAAIARSPYFHVGGDEVKKLTAAQYKQFIERAQSIVRKHGLQMVGWDEIAHVDLHTSSIVQHWRPKTTPQEALAKGVTFILSPADRIYIDMKYDATTALGLDWAARIEVRQAYDWDPATLFEGIPESAILGVEAPLWSETVANMRDVEYLMFPRIAAAAEIAWTPAAGRQWDDFRARLRLQEPRWTALGINFYRSPQVF